MQGLELNWLRVLKIFWAFTWRSLLGSAAIALLALPVGMGLIGVGVPDRLAIWIMIPLEWALAIAWACAALKMALLNQYRDFCVLLVPHPEASTS